MELRHLIVNGLLIGLFLFAIVSFGVHLAEENNVNNTILGNEAFNETFGGLRSNLTDSQTIAESQREAQELDIPTEESDSLPLKSAPKIAKAFTGMWRNMYSLTLGLISKTLGISPVVTSTITAILLITVTLLIWGFIKSGR